MANACDAEKGGQADVAPIGRTGSEDLSHTPHDLKPYKTRSIVRNPRRRHPQLDAHLHVTGRMQCLFTYSTYHVVLSTTQTKSVAESKQCLVARPLVSLGQTAGVVETMIMLAWRSWVSVCTSGAQRTTATVTAAAIRYCFVRVKILFSNHFSVPSSVARASTASHAGYTLGKSLRYI